MQLNIKEYKIQEMCTKNTPKMEKRIEMYNSDNNEFVVHDYMPEYTSSWVNRLKCHNHDPHLSPKQIKLLVKTTLFSTDSDTVNSSGNGIRLHHVTIQIWMSALWCHYITHEDSIVNIRQQMPFVEGWILANLKKKKKK